MTENYPRRGLAFCASHLCASLPSIRAKASKLGLKLDRTVASDFFVKFQAQAAKTKVGRKRPAQAVVMKTLHTTGRLRRSPESMSATVENLLASVRQNGHPRGFLGAAHTPAAKLRMSIGTRLKWALMTDELIHARNVKASKTRRERGVVLPSHGRLWHAGWREIGGRRIYARSRWEANYARYLQWMKDRKEIAEWEHEPETFWFDGVLRGWISYIPDFRVTGSRGDVEYHEVKGWMDERSITKLKLMEKHHPQTTVIVIERKHYRQIEMSFARTIEGWE